MVIVIQGKRHFLRRVVNNEGEVLKFFVDPKRNAKAASTLIHELLKKNSFPPTQIETDYLKS
jgi:putative transposase